MKKLLIIFCFWPAFVQAQIPVYDIHWGMSQRDVHAVLPADTHTGTMQYYMIPFAGFPVESHPVEARFFYPNGNGLSHIEFSPLYVYPETEDWQGDYVFINQFMTGTYGEPYEVDGDISTWVTTETTGRFVQHPGVGWNVRFDSREGE